MAIIFLKPTFLRVMFAALLLIATAFSTSCSLIDKGLIGEIKEESLASEGEQPPASNNYQGLRFETTQLDFSVIEASFPRLVCLGDSVTFGWNLSYEKTFSFLLEKELRKQYSEAMVINSGIGGQTIIDGLNRLENDLFYFEPQLVIINFGLNDAFIVIEEDSQEQISTASDLKNNIDLDTFTDIYKQLVGELLEKDIEIIIMGTNPVIIESIWENENIAQKQEESYVLYNRAAKDIAEDHGLMFVNIQKSFIADGQSDILIQPDGLHPSEAGLILISEILYKSLKSVDLSGKE
jgi:lysophospholipase L1-like esterase